MYRHMNVYLYFMKNDDYDDEISAGDRMMVYCHGL